MEQPARRIEERAIAAEDKLFNFRPVLSFALFLSLGVWFGHLCIYYGVSPWWACCLVPVAATPFFFCRTNKKRKQTAIAVLALALCFALGGGGFALQIHSFTNAGAYQGEYTVVGRVIEKSKGEGNCTLTLTDVYIGENKEKGKLIAYLPASFYETVTLSDKVFLSGNVVTDTSLSDTHGFRAYAVEENIRFSMTAKDCTVTGHTFDLFCFLRTRMTDAIYAGMDETTAGVTVAVLFGDTTGIDNGLLENIRQGGIAHIFAVSGLHIGALFAACVGVMQKTRLQKTPKLVRLFLTAAVLLLYGGVCGFSASVVRAIVTCLLFYASNLLGTDSDSSENLGAAAFLLIALSPCTLFTVGFQLSFAACFGIVWIAKPMIRRINRLLDHKRIAAIKKGEDTHPRTVWETMQRAVVSFLCVSVSAQIATAPVLLSSFGYLSVWSLLLNCIFVPILSALFWVLLLLVLVASLLPLSLSGVVLYLPTLVWSALLLVFQVFDFSSIQITNVEISSPLTLCYFALLSMLSDKWNIKKGLQIFLICALFLSFGVGMYALNA